MSSSKSLDREELFKLDQECMGDEAWTFPSWEGIDEGYLLLFHETRKAFILFLTPKGDDTAHLLKIAVAPSFRGQGLSRQLFLQAFPLLLKQGICKIYLEVATDNDVAVSLYKALGFKILHKCRNFYTNGKDAYKMLLEITYKP